jgi:PKD repeat protein
MKKAIPLSLILLLFISTTTQGVIIGPINANFIASPTSGPPPLIVTFADRTNGEITSWLWDFGDGLTSTEQNPSHTYTEVGTYTVSLTVEGPEGSDIETKTDFINVRGSKAMPWIPLLLLSDTSPGTPIVTEAGNQLSVHGTNDVAVHEQITNPPTSALDLPTFTIEAWIYPEYESDMIIVADSAYYLMIRSQPLSVQFAVMTSTGFPAVLTFSGTTNPLELNQWNHVAGMVDNFTKALQIAVNGELSEPSTMGGTVNVSFPQTFSVGNSYPQTLGDYPFIGRIDEVRLSSRIRYIGNFIPPSLLDPDGGTLGLWHFDEAQGATTFADSSGNGNTLTGLGGAATIAATREVQASENSLFYSLRNLEIGQTSGPCAIGDFNHDGNNDTAVAGVYAVASANVAILLGTGAGSFDPPAYFSTGVSGSHPSIVSGDFNNDGNLDLAVGNSGSNSVSVLLGTGTGSFGTATVITLVGSYVTTGDFDSDGNLDLAVANTGSDSVSVLLGTGTGSFGTASDFTVGDAPLSVTAGDFDGDGNLDLAVANSGSNSVSVLLGTGTGSFGTATDFPVGNYPISVAAGDFDSDGKLDLATANFSTANVSILLGTGTGAFNLSENIAVPWGGPAYMAIGDIDSDGKLDIAVASGGGNTVFSILLGDGTGSFDTPVTYSSGNNPLSVAIGDLTGDGKSDLAIGVSFTYVQIYLTR